MNQQDKQTQQQDKKGVFVESQTLEDLYSYTEAGGGIFLILFFISLAGFALTNNIAADLLFGIIAIFSFLGGLILAAGSDKVNKYRSKKIKKIIKEITFYEDGQVEEKEAKYE